MFYNVNLRSCLRHSVLLLFVFLGLNTYAIRADEQEGRGVPDQVVANYIHAVIEADRTLYATHVVERMKETGTAMASENWEERNTLPLPAQMLQLSGERVKNTGEGLHYRLASLWPIYHKNGPTNDFERKGLEAVQQHPDEPYTGYITHGEETFYTAIYADRAVSKACVNCHNRHLLSPRRDHKFGDVMGGIIISFPVHKH